MGSNLRNCRGVGSVLGGLGADRAKTAAAQHRKAAISPRISLDSHAPAH